VIDTPARDVTAPGVLVLCAAVALCLVGCAGAPAGSGQVPPVMVASGPPAPPTTAAPESTAVPPTSVTHASAASTAAGTPEKFLSLPTLPPLEPKRQILLLGDSVAYDLSPAVVAALRASGVDAASYAYPGLGVIPRTYRSFTYFDDALAAVQPDLVIYQVSLWDAASVDRQALAYRSFVDSVLATGADLVLISPPLVREDQRVAALDTLPPVLSRLLADHPARMRYIDAGDFWTDVYRDDVDADSIPERKPDGVHVCPAGARRYAAWLLGELASIIDDFTAAAEQTWASGDWSADARYHSPPEICAPRLFQQP
jgi:hypothetical protein